MSRIHKLRLGVSPEDVKSLLACEHRPVMRKRLRALLMLLKGASVGRAAIAANVSKMAVEAWVRLVRAWGCSGLLTVEKPFSSQAARDEAAVREQIRIALKGKLSLRLRKRLIALDRLLAGEIPQEVAGKMRVHGGPLEGWITEVRKTGLSEILGWKNFREVNQRAAAGGDGIRSASDDSAIL